MTYVEEAGRAMEELVASARLTSGMTVVVGCSTSEILGETIGTESSFDVAKQVFDAIYAVCKRHGIYLAAQCCEHLNRAIIVERVRAATVDTVNVVPQPKAGGSFATAAYRTFDDPVAIERIRADAGLDIGNTLIGMHLKEVAVPLRLSVKRIGSAPIVAARTRPKCIGGSRAVYDESLL